MSELHVTWWQDLPIRCGGCGHKFVPPDGAVLGIDDQHPDQLWPVVRCPSCHETVACSLAHVKQAVIS